jgi:hypothetical protein
MTPARQARKSLGMVVLALAVMVGAAGALVAATTERIVTDRHTGLALYGYDPVAYFTEGKAVLGLPDHELRHRGVIWRFRNEGNRAAFMADPDIYMPRYGGYDPVGVARGVATPGHPDLWVRVGSQLYLFYTVEGRDSFAAEPKRVIGLAELRWPDVERTLTP